MWTLGACAASARCHDQPEKVRVSTTSSGSSKARAVCARRRTSRQAELLLAGFRTSPKSQTCDFSGTDCDAPGCVAMSNMHSTHTRDRARDYGNAFLGLMLLGIIMMVFGLALASA